MLGKVKHKGIVLAILATAQFMNVLDATIVNVALPAIQKSLGFTATSQLQWVVTAYALAFGGFLLLGGRLADLFGRRRIFLTGAVVFAIASLAGGLAQNPTSLIAFRALQGLGGALLAPSAFSLILTIFEEGKERARALGVMSMVAGGGGAVGLLLGGILTEYADWRWNFFINLPIAIGVIVLALRYVPETKPQSKDKIDYVGALAITGSLMSLVYGLAQAPTSGWGSSTTLMPLSISAVLMATFIINELKVKNPLVPLSIFKRRNVSGGSIIQLFMPAALFGMFFYLSIYMQAIMHYSPVQTGLANVPFTIILIIVAGTLSRKITKLNPKPLLVIAPLIVGAGLLYFARIPVHSNYVTDILPGVALMSAGMAIVFVTTAIVATAGVSHKESGLVSGLLNTGQQLGGAIGLAVLSVISTTVTKQDLIDAHGNPAHVPAALVHGFQQGFVAAAGFALAASIVALVVIKSVKPTQSDKDRVNETEAEALAAIPGV